MSHGWAAATVANENCALSSAPRLAIWRPAPDLAPFVSGYHLYAVDDNGGEPNRGAFEPAWASLRFAVVTEWWRVRFTGKDWQEPPRSALFGPSSKLAWSESGSGILVGVGLRPRGWARLFAQRAKDWSNRIDEIPRLGQTDPSTLIARFRALSNDDDVPAILDEVLRAAMRRASADEPKVAALEAALVDPSIRSVAELTDILQMPLRNLQRSSDRAFGFSPRLLLRRARFLRSLHAIRASGRRMGSLAIDPAYTDYSHFIRDAHDFLGMSPQAFLDRDMPLLKASLHLRERVIGTPAQALDPAVGF
ncbi:helix-turn-helix domain-containing protein [Tsuneonella troitsensis]|uniref:helix-turn-helix domain-containing protein n=1 Tax=Tsuneonella troitsensis TaxID=292222 RepID=UPI00070D76C8|nr:helix-turn-helix domain-containing protein [Tsuneonella troitsensis]